ncbi:MAG: hypothetical protein ACLUJC_11640 [Clostridia bacterium]
MFRFTTEVKGLAIDFDSFEEPIESWNEIANDFNFLFITTVPESKENIENTLYAKTLLINRMTKNLFRILKCRQKFCRVWIWIMKKTLL